MRRTPTRREVVVGASAALAGCSVLPEESEPIEASAETPAALSGSGADIVVASETVTFETTIDVDLSGDVQISSQQDVTATIYQRVYEHSDGHRFGVLTAPAVTVIDKPEIVRDPLTGLGTARVVGFATAYDVESVNEWNTDGATTVLGTEQTRRRTTGSTGAGDRTFVMARVRAGADSVTAMATSPDDWTPPFGDVTRSA
jgi:hypothetical protein